MDELARKIEAERRVSPRPYIVAITGSVAVGKSTLASSLARWKVDIVATDGFLFPNAVLETRGLMQRKGSPESYDQAALDRFVVELKSGIAPLRVPLYSRAHRAVPRAGAGGD